MALSPVKKTIFFPNGQMTGFDRLRDPKQGRYYASGFFAFVGHGLRAVPLGAEAMRERHGGRSLQKRIRALRRHGRR
jgi:hypothetical protein